MPPREIIVAQQLAPYFEPHQALLEIGAGKGLVAHALAQATRADITLLDVVDYNQSSLPMRVYDGTALPFPEASFDYALLVFVLHHTPDPLQVLTEALRVSRRGVFIVENHVEGFLRQRLTRAIDSIPHYQYGVPVCYHTNTAQEWCRLFAQLPVRVDVLSQFHIDYFWQNVVIKLTK